MAHNQTRKQDRSEASNKSTHNFQRFGGGVLHTVECPRGVSARLFARARVFRSGLPYIKTFIHSHDPPPALQRRKDTELASALQVYDFHFSILHRLPWELILQIAEHMDTVDCIVFKLSCRRHASIDNAVGTLKLTKAEKKHSARRLERDIFEALAAVEPSNAGLPSKMLCCSCKTLHLRSSFMKTEARKPAHQRKCIGTAGTFRFCKHSSLGFEGLQKLCSTQPRKGYSDYSCYKCYSLKRIPAPFHPSIGRKYNDVIRNCDGNIHTFRTVLYEGYSTDGMLRAELCSYVKKHPNLICPHTRLNDPSFLAAIMGEYASKRRETRSQRIPDWFASSSTSAYVARTCSFCDSTVYLARAVEEDKGYIVAAVYRNFGKMEDVMDPYWLSQLEEERQRPYTHKSMNQRRREALQILEAGHLAIQELWASRLR